MPEARRRSVRSHLNVLAGGLVGLRNGFVRALTSIPGEME
jgi:hypothetical protein